MPQRTAQRFPSGALAGGRRISPTRRGPFPSQILLAAAILLGAIGVSSLAIWVDWTKWAISRWQSQLPSLPTEEAIRLLHQLGPHTPASIPLLVQGLCDSRPEVAQAAENQLQTLQQRWENLAWHQVAETLAVLADCLAKQVDQVPPHSRQTARQLAEWILAWHPPEGSSGRSQMIAACEKVLEGLTQADRGLPQSSQAGASIFSEGKSDAGKGETKNLPTWKNILHPLEGFQMPGGGLQVGQFPGESLLVGGPFSAAAERSLDGQARSQERPLMNISSSETFLRIRDPVEASAFGRIAGGGLVRQAEEDSTGNRPRLNQPVRLAEKGLGQSDNEYNSSMTPPGQAAQSPDQLGEKESSAEQAAGGATLQRFSASANGPNDLPKKEVRELLLLLAAGPEQEQKFVQAELARRGFGQVSRSLARQLADPNPQVRLEVLRRLPSMTEVEPVAWLFWLCGDSDVEVRSTAIALLATTKDPVILRQLEKLLSGQPEDLRREQTKQLRTFGPPMQ